MKADLESAAEIIKKGGVGAFPTETVYGMGAHPFHSSSLDRIFVLKGRRKKAPLALHIGSLTDLYKFAQEPPKELNKIVVNFWPGPLAVILPASPVVPPQATSNKGTVSFRYPDESLFREFARLAGVPIAATSANRSGSLSAICPLDVEAELGEEIDFLIDGGVTKYKFESTIVDLSSKPFFIPREGVIKKEELEDKTGFQFQLVGPQIKGLSLVLIEGSKSFFSQVASQLKLQDYESLLSFFPVESRHYLLEESIGENKLFELLSRLGKEGFMRLYVHCIWPKSSRLYQRLRVRAERIIWEKRKEMDK